ncbi:MAG: CoA transferase [Caulobacter sp.]
MVELQERPGEAAIGADADAQSASLYAQRLLSELGFGFRPLGAADHPAISWVRSGMAAVTGRQRGRPLMAPVGLSAIADGALLALTSLAPKSSIKDLRGAGLLGERSRLAGLSRQGAISAGGGCRLLPTADGVLAVSLVRSTDWDFAPAWLEADIGDWDDVGRVLADRSLAQVLEQGRCLGLAVADADPAPGGPAVWRRTVARGPSRSSGGRGAPLVVDLSALWAGPLCTDLLGRLGARVIKVESRSRLDGARAGPADFHARLNGGKSSVMLDFNDAQDRAALQSLIEAADIVVESSRPRGLRQLGIHAEDIIARRPGLTWIAISGHGRSDPEADWIGYGDDTAVAAGLSRCMKDVYGDWLFCGDAVADPLTGLHAALLAWTSWQKGGGVLEEISLSGVVAFAMAADGDLTAVERRARTWRWRDLARGVEGQRYDLPGPRGLVQEPGASNQAILGGQSPC